MKASWNGAVLAESEQPIVVEGNYYFPPASVAMQYMSAGTERYNCPWKGETSYFTITVDGKINSSAAWYYANPLPKAAELGIKGYVAFWKGVEVTP